MHDELTQVDIDKMKEELQHRIQVLRPQLIEEVKVARSFGDLSENFEYKAAKREKNRNDSRIRYLENMINRKGEEFSAFVKLNMTTGNPQYSRTPDGFTEQQAPRIPAEVYGHVFTAQERANLQDGKAILISDLKNNGNSFSSYLKVNATTGQLQYFQENPDLRRDTSRRAAQADNTRGEQQEQKRNAKRAV